MDVKGRYRKQKVDMMRLQGRLIEVLTILAVTTAIILGAFTCGKKDAGEIKVGVIQPLTGDLAEPGNQALRGIQLAVSNYNSTNPSRRIKLIVEDSQANPADGVSAINKLINVDNVKLVLGDLTSGVTLAIAPIAQKEHVTLLAPGASNPKLREAGDYIFRNWTADNFDGEVIGRYLVNKMNKKSAAILMVNNEYGIGLTTAFSKVFEDLGGSVLFEEGYEQGSSDFRSIISKVNTAEIDCIFLPGHPRENGFLVRQIRELRYSQTIAANLSVESPDFYVIAKESCEGVVFSTPAFDLESNEEIVQSFRTAFESEFGVAPDAVAGHGFDAANIIIEALKRAQFNEDEVKDQLYGISDFPGITGRTTFDDHGDVIKPMMIKILNADGSASILEVYNPQ